MAHNPSGKRLLKGLTLTRLFNMFLHGGTAEAWFIGCRCEAIDSPSPASRRLHYKNLITA